ncbi:glycerol-3-phosphate O-acyltransferase [Bradyrhizobium sp. USDA 4011]
MDAAAIRIAPADLAVTAINSCPDAAVLPRVSALTLTPLMQHLSASLSLLDEKVIRDDPPTASRSRCESIPADVCRIHPAIRRLAFRPVTESGDRDANPDCLNDRRVDAMNASDPPARPEENWGVPISSNIADERLMTAYRAKLAHVYVRQ